MLVLVLMIGLGIVQVLVLGQVATFAQEVLATARTVRRAFTSRSISALMVRSTPRPGSFDSKRGGGG